MEHHYHINLFWDQRSGCWIADVPDLKYCFAHGATPAEAAAEVQVAIELWLDTARDEGLPIPEPRYSSASAAEAA